MESYITSTQKQFAYYKQLGDQTLARLNFEQMRWQYNAQSNSVNVIVKHLVGNMLSRWTQFYEEDGEKPWRQRDSEFEDEYTDKTAVLAHWEKGWDCLFAVINSLRPGDLTRIIYIRNQGHTVLEAINRQLCHYSYHIGQLVYLGRMIQGESWESLSIPKNESTAYNKAKFIQKKEKRHFTDDLY